jgi:hypothetical protein
MRKLLFFFPILLTINALGQVSSSPALQQEGLGPVFIVPVQMGTDTLKNGADTIRLTDETLMEMKQALASPGCYTVTLTPRGTCGPLNLAKITARYFIVKPQGSASSDGFFDYVLFSRQKRPMMPVRPRSPGTQLVRLFYCFQYLVFPVQKILIRYIPANPD